MNNDETLIHIKANLIDIWNECGTKPLVAEEWFALFQGIIQRYFDIQTSELLLFQYETFIPLNFHHSNDLKFQTIRWTDIREKMENPVLLKNLTILPPRYSIYEEAFLFGGKEEEPVAMLLIQATPAWEEFRESDAIYGLEEVIRHFIHTVKKQIFMRQQEKQYRDLFTVTEMVHATMDIDRILEAVLHAMDSSFPRLKTELVLANDQNRQTNRKVKLFDYSSEREKAIEAYVSGEVLFDPLENEEMYIMHVPIKGRQGIYGLLKVYALNDYFFSKRQKEFIQMLAHTFGNALEKAKLYHQSHRLISDLQLINETSHKMNTSMKMDEMVYFLEQQLEKSFQPSEICFVFIEDEEWDVTTTKSPFFMNEGKEYLDFVSSHFLKTNEALFLADYHSKVNPHLPYASLMAQPLMDRGEVAGYCLVLHENPYYFSFDSHKLMQSLIQHCSLAFSNAKLRLQLQELVDRDHLTGLYARSYLDKYFSQSLENDTEGAFLLLDIDNFKHVNDTYGHQMGDQLLCQISSLIKKLVGNRGISARWGGEELAIYLPNHSLEDGSLVATNILQSIPTHTSPSITVSGGISHWNQLNKPDMKDIFQSADKALYKAKNSGKNKLCI
ncbi:sensor domain-containing diguanylate cyclase [Paenisporosarcina cavernae]|uniref:Sensor domain-containing diguanylate cyclase n=1 Tax=Paenisporosarcina cavernae TaxID=2320858 RepID=A0A385YSS4_9BACL|nr:sensor domain-containing diguanylate cyclase [Paenisporosarcina cavernae]AYC29859.1 sensor domain-containing diguanylate cyclase [Paenisporosarcina cavernae]